MGDERALPLGTRLHAASSALGGDLHFGQHRWRYEVGIAESGCDA